MAPNQGQLGLCLAQGRTRPEPREDVNRMGSATSHISCSVLAQRRIHVGFIPVQPEACGRDANHGVALLVKNNRRTERVWPSGEVALPETVAQDHHGRGAGPVFVGQEGAPLREIYAYNGKYVGRDFAEVDIFRLSRLANRASVVERRGRLERAALAPAIEKIRVGNILFAIYFCVPRIGMAVHRDQPVWFWIRQRFEKHTIDEGEHHRRGANAQSERQQSHSHEPGPLPKGTNGIANVLKKIRKPAPSPHVPPRFCRNSDVPEFPARGGPGFLPRSARFHFLALGECQVRWDFFLELFIALLSSPQWESHDSLSSFAGFKTPEIASISLAHRERSANKCLFPDWVR